LTRLLHAQIAALLFGGLALATQLDAWAQNEWPVITLIATFGSFMAYIYSAPPLKLKAEVHAIDASFMYAVHHVILVMR